MKALLLNDNVVDVANEEFEVHPSLTWMDAPDECKAGWKLVDGILQAPPGPTSEEAARMFRRKRDNLLAATDWIVVMHTEKGTNIPAAWEIYRQELRDITSHVNWPFLEKSDWPVSPE